MQENNFLKLQTSTVAQSVVLGRQREDNTNLRTRITHSQQSLRERPMLKQYIAKLTGRSVARYLP